MFDLTGRTAFVSGGGQGVGAGIASALALQGASVAVNDLFEDRAASTVDQIKSAGGNAVAVGFDVCDYDAVKSGMAEVESGIGTIDILVNNAGVPPGMGVQQFRETTPEQWRPYIDLNTYGVMNCTHVLLDGMCERGHGRVITISSGAAR